MKTLKIVGGPLAKPIVLSDQRAKRETHFPSYVPPRIYDDELAPVVPIKKKPHLLARLNPFKGRGR